MHEYLKRSASFWHPYISILPDVQFFCYWSQEELDAVNDPGLVQEAESYKEELDNEWTDIQKALLTYP